MAMDNNGKEITIEDLAGMIQRGFEETAKKADMEARFEEVNTRFEEVNTRFEEVDTRFDEVNARFDEVNARLERIENLLVSDHQHRIAKLEDDVRVLKDALNMR